VAAGSGTMTPAPVSSGYDGRVVRVRLAGTPDNALDSRLVNGLLGALDAVPDDAALLVLEAAGPDFCPGWRDPSLRTEMGRIVPSPADVLAALPMPTVAVVRGVCAGPGMELALACDLVWADPGATFRLAALRDAERPVWGGIQRLVRAIGPARALEWLLAGRDVPVPEAVTAGLVSRVVAGDEDMEASLADLARAAPWALWAAKQALVRGRDLTLAQALELEADLYALLETTEDRQEGVAAFLAKRPPRFRGR
jgi:enoyl-CoA hydratase/carnithine racemase